MLRFTSPHTFALVPLEIFHAAVRLTHVSILFNALSHGHVV